MYRWGAWRGHRAPNILKFARKLVKKVSQAARGMATVFSVTFSLFSNNLLTIVGQLVRTLPPPKRRFLGTSLPSTLFNHNDLIRGNAWCILNTENMLGRRNRSPRNKSPVPAAAFHDSVIAVEWICTNSLSWHVLWCTGPYVTPVRSQSSVSAPSKWPTTVFTVYNSLVESWQAS